MSPTFPTKEHITLVLNLLLHTWQLPAVPGSLPDTSEGSSPNADMVLEVKVIVRYWQLMAVLVSTLLEEMHLAMVSVLESNFFYERHYFKVSQLFNRNFAEISKKAPRKLSCWG